MLLWITAKEASLRFFQYKLLNNILYLNKILFRFEKTQQNKMAEASTFFGEKT